MEYTANKSHDKTQHKQVRNATRGNILTFCSASPALL